MVYNPSVHVSAAAQRVRHKVQGGGETRTRSYGHLLPFLTSSRSSWEEAPHGGGDFCMETRACPRPVPLPVPVLSQSLSCGPHHHRPTLCCFPYLSGGGGRLYFPQQEASVNINHNSSTQDMSSVSVICLFKAHINKKKHTKITYR